jgi:hypothetical protein
MSLPGWEKTVVGGSLMAKLPLSCEKTNERPMLRRIRSPEQGGWHFISSRQDARNRTQSLPLPIRHLCRIGCNTFRLAGRCRCRGDERTYVGISQSWSFLHSPSNDVASYIAGTPAIATTSTIRSATNITTPLPSRTTSLNKSAFINSSRCMTPPLRQHNCAQLEATNR